MTVLLAVALVAVVLSVHGLVLTVAFVAFGAPDVALSQLGVGAAVVPLMVLLALAKTRHPAEPGANQRPRFDASAAGAGSQAGASDQSDAARDPSDPE